MFKLLTGLDKINVVSKPFDGSTNFKPGMVAAIVNGEAVLPPSNGYMPVYVVLSDAADPVTKTAGSISLAYGDMRIQVSSDLLDTAIASLNPGDALIATTNGKMAQYAGSGNIIGFVEEIDAANDMVTIRIV